jgi:type I restriction enzyme M protein
MGRFFMTQKDKKRLDTQTLEQKLWASADKLRGHFNLSDYKYVVLGFIFLKYISDAFEEYYQQLEEKAKKSREINPEDSEAAELMLLRHY